MIFFFEKVRKHFNFLFLVVVTPCCSTTTEHDKWVVDNKIINKAFAKTKAKKLKFTEESFTNTITEIGNSFLGAEKATVKELTLALPSLTTIGSDFCSESGSLKKVTLKLPALKSIDNNFLNECEHLTALKGVQQSFGNLNKVKDNFLEGSHLKKFSLKAEELEKIGTYFLSSCQELSTVELSFKNLKLIERDFLSDCPALENITLELPKVTEIKTNFLSGASSLKTFSLQLPTLTEINRRFLADCGKLQTLELTCLKLNKVKSEFLARASSLQELTLDLPALTEVGTHFLASCSALKKLTLTLPKVNRIKGFFLLELSSLKELTLQLPALTEINRSFLTKASSLQELTLDLPALISIGPSFLADCPAIEKLELTLPDLNGLNSSALEQLNRSTLTLNLKDLKKADSKILGNLGKVKKLTIVAPELTEIEEGCLFNCPALEEVRFEFPKLVGTSDNCWLEGCNNLTYFSLRAPLLKKINKASLPNNEGLKELDLSGCTALESADLDLLDKQENSISTLLPSSLKRATLSDQQSTTADNTPSSGYANWILPSTFLVVGGILCFLYYSQPIKRERTKKKAKEPEGVPNASVTNEQRT